MSDAGSTIATAGRRCPHCGAALERRGAAGIGVDGCKACQSLLINQVDLPRLLDILSAGVVGDDPFAELPSLPDRSGDATCPFCQGLMEKGDYCGAKIVFFDRCEPCAALWIGRDELAAMSRIWNRMEQRSARTKAQLAEDLALMDAIFYAHVNIR
jgi:Zn-finger nucleic acid-binding protein